MLHVFEQIGETQAEPISIHSGGFSPLLIERCCVCEQIRKTQAEPQWIVAQRLLSALTIPGFT